MGGIGEIVVSTNMLLVAASWRRARSYGGQNVREWLLYYSCTASHPTRYILTTFKSWQIFGLCILLITRTVSVLQHVGLMGTSKMIGRDMIGRLHTTRLMLALMPIAFLNDEVASMSSIIKKGIGGLQPQNKKCPSLLS